MLANIPHLSRFGDIGWDGHIFIARRCVSKLVFLKEIDPYLPVIARILKATGHPGPALMDLYHGREYPRLTGIVTLYIRDEATLVAIERAPWFKSAMAQFRMSFRVMSATELVPHTWCEDWETWFFKPGTQLHWLLCASWQYYMLNHSFLSDEAYDVLARMLLLNYDWLAAKGHPHLKHCPKSALESGGSLYAEVHKFPMMVKHAGYILYEKFALGQVRSSFS